ncbi:ABC transporter permease subunit [Alcaligenaceae bacterium]|nr:ABC transporter permease subunit [Alcaligenaceae bacterium]
MIILGRSGFLNDTLLQLGVIERPLRILYTEASVVIGLTYICLPFVVLAVVASLQSIDKSLFQASTDLGGDAWSTFWNVTWPLSLPGVLGGTVIAFTISVSAYVTPSVMLGGRGSVMSIVIYDQYMAAMNFNFGAALAVALTITALVLMVFQSTVMERKLKWART